MSICGQIDCLEYGATQEQIYTSTFFHLHQVSLSTSTFFIASDFIPHFIWHLSSGLRSHQRKLIQFSRKQDSHRSELDWTRIERSRHGTSMTF
jgi:hypothetical protein